MTAQYVRDYYKVPAKRGGRIAWTSPSGVKWNGTIVGFRGQYLRVRFDAPGPPGQEFKAWERRVALRDGIHTLHPTDNVQYLEAARETQDG